MSVRRSISFADDEQDLLAFFDSNGKSDIAKVAMQFYKDNKDNVITEGIINLFKVMGLSTNIGGIVQKQNVQDKFTKWKK